MELHVLNHPLVEHKLTVLRDKNTPSSTFPRARLELVMREPTRPPQPVRGGRADPGPMLDDRQARLPRPIIVPVLRAGRHARRHDPPDSDC